MIETIDEYRNNSEYMRCANYIVPGLLYDIGMISSPLNYAEYIAGENFSMIEDSLEGQKLREFFEEKPYLKPENFLQEVLCSDEHHDIRGRILGNPKSHEQIAKLLDGASQYPELFHKKICRQFMRFMIKCCCISKLQQQQIFSVFIEDTKAEKKQEESKQKLRLLAVNLREL